METNRIDYSIIRKYLDGKLSPGEMHAIEKQAMDDPFLAEAIEGYSDTDTLAGRQLSLLQKQLEERIALQHENKSVFFFTWQRLSVAAAAGLMFISAGILFWMKADSNRNRVPHQKQVEVRLTPADSLGISLPAVEAVAAENGGIDAASVPVPALGWNTFNAYLRRSIQINSSNVVGGTVTVVFHVGAQGELSDFRIEKGINKVLDREAIRLIKEGPAWKSPSGKKNVQSRILIKFNK